MKKAWNPRIDIDHIYRKIKYIPWRNLSKGWHSFHVWENWVVYGLHDVVWFVTFPSNSTGETGFSCCTFLIQGRRKVCKYGGQLFSNVAKICLDWLNYCNLQKSGGIALPAPTSPRFRQPCFNEGKFQPAALHRVNTPPCTRLYHTTHFIKYFTEVVCFSGWNSGII